MAWRRALRAGGVVGLAALLVGWFPTAASAATGGFTITDSRITKSSGLARDTGGNLYWTANDSGTNGVAYGLTSKGKVRGSLTFRAQPEDVEAVAVHAEVPTECLRQMIYAYPTFHRGIEDALRELRD